MHKETHNDFDLEWHLSPRYNDVLASMNPKNLQVDVSHQKKPTTTLSAHPRTLDTDLAPSSSSQSPAGDAPCPHSPPSSHNIDAAVEAPEPNSRPTRGHRREDRDGSRERLVGNRDYDEETQCLDAVGGNKDARLALGGGQAETCL
jgi:hypothetical protein